MNTQQKQQEDGKRSLKEFKARISPDEKYIFVGAKFNEEGIDDLEVDINGISSRELMAIFSAIVIRITKDRHKAADLFHLTAIKIIKHGGGLEKSFSGEAE